MERDSLLQVILHISRKPHKIPLNKKALRKNLPSMFHVSGAPMETDVHFQTLLNISFGVHSKEALPQGPLLEIPHREMPRS